MLYVFHVDTGTMMTFDMNLALESVSQLKDAIERSCGISVDKQVLLASGGESLEPQARVCSYSVGTDTSPIFLFSKAAIESTTPPQPSIDYGPDSEMKEEVDASLNLPASIHTVGVRSHLAQHMCDLARHQVKACDSLVHDQHLQQQGWASVVANLDDITAAFKTRSEMFEQSFKQHIETREQYIAMLDSFESDLETLGKVPVLPALLEKDSSECEGGESRPQDPLSLLQWISAKDHQFSLQQVADQCRKGLDQFDGKVLEGLKSEVSSTLEAANTCELREIKGLEERLYGLEQLRQETKKIVREQTDLAQAFLQNQARASNLGDASILPDLCASHKRQLVVMLRNHHHLRDIRRRCVKAKQELSTNLYHRLKGVMFVESKICEMDLRLVMYHESVKRLRRQLEILQQLHTAPTVYLTAVAEVVRRRTFSQAFLMWANDLSCQVCAVHSEEVARRKHFQSQFEGHFLASLFPGLEDSPPPFATSAPQLFDSNLPKLSLEDIESLRRKLPDLALSLSIPDLTSITQFFLSRSVTNLKPEPVNNPAASIEDRIVQAVTAVGLSSNLDPALLQQPADNSQSSAHTTQPISDRGFESETDTEEFEKVGQSPSEMANVMKQGVGEGLVGRMSGCVDEAVRELRSEMGELKDWILCEKKELLSLIDQITVTASHQAHHLASEVERKSREVSSLEKLNYELESRLKRVMESVEREREERERGEREHKAQLELVRARYKLCASINQPLDRSLSTPRSPTNTFDKQDRVGEGETADKTSQESVIARLTEEKEMAVREERTRWEARLAHELSQAKLRHDAERQVVFNEAVRKVVTDKERQMENMRAREVTLLEECSKHRDTIHRLTNTGSLEVLSDSLVQRVSELESEKCRLVTELSRLRGVSSSSSIVSATSDSEMSSRDAATSPEPSPRLSRMKDKLTKSATSLIHQGKISTSSCKLGDAVLVVWDNNLGTYSILQDSSSLYLLHKDCVEELGLQGTNPRRLYSTAEVIHKEYCRARTGENQYHVAKGTKFYRVKVKPLGSLSQNSQLSSSDPSA